MLLKNLFLNTSLSLATLAVFNQPALAIEHDAHDTPIPAPQERLEVDYDLEATIEDYRGRYRWSARIYCTSGDESCFGSAVGARSQNGLTTWRKNTLKETFKASTTEYSSLCPSMNLEVEGLTNKKKQTRVVESNCEEVAQEEFESPQDGYFDQFKLVGSETVPDECAYYSDEGCEIYQDSRRTSTFTDELRITGYKGLSYRPRTVDIPLHAEPEEYSAPIENCSQIKVNGVPAQGTTDNCYVRLRTKGATMKLTPSVDGQTITSFNNEEIKPGGLYIIKFGQPLVYKNSAS